MNVNDLKLHEKYTYYVPNVLGASIKLVDIVEHISTYALTNFILYEFFVESVWYLGNIKYIHTEIYFAEKGMLVKLGEHTITDFVNIYDPEEQIIESL